MREKTPFEKDIQSMRRFWTIAVFALVLFWLWVGMAVFRAVHK